MSDQPTREQLLDEGDKKRGNDPVLPYRVQINLTVAHMDPEVINAMVDGLIGDAEHRGFFFEWGYNDVMPLEDVIPDSPLDKVVRGEDDAED